MNKTEALARLAQVESETAALRKIIEAPEKLPGLWRPQRYGKYCTVRALGGVRDWEDCVGEYPEQYAARGNCFPSREIAEKAAPLMARANKIIAAALQVDPDAGPWADDRRYCALLCNGEWDDGIVTNNGVRDFRLVHVHTVEQSEEMARILNAEGI